MWDVTSSIYILLLMCLGTQLAATVVLFSVVLDKHEEREGRVWLIDGTTSEIRVSSGLLVNESGADKDTKIEAPVDSTVEQRIKEEAPPNIRIDPAEEESKEEKKEELNENNSTLKVDEHRQLEVTQSTAIMPDGKPPSHPVALKKSMKFKSSIEMSTLASLEIIGMEDYVYEDKVYVVIYCLVC